MRDPHHTRIIVVEDDDATRRLLERQLQSAGYKVRAFSEARAALDGVAELGTGIVVADWNMPSMSGIELCQAIRELESMQALGDIYFIMLTAYNSKEQTIAGLEAGANDYLTKPYHHGELLARIQVGRRVLGLQVELRRQTIEFQKANLELALLSRKLEEMANTDALTSLANRRCLLNRLNEVWASCERNGQPLGCIMIDVDRFKRINDTFGHEAGDEVLRCIATRLRSISRRPDLCGRLGGEEFAIVWPGADRDAAAEIAEQVRTAIAGTPALCNGVSISLTISAGVAQRTEFTEKPGDLVRAADDMLYAAKARGRNQTWILHHDRVGRPYGAPSTSEGWTSRFKAEEQPTPVR